MGCPSPDGYGIYKTKCGLHPHTGIPVSNKKEWSTSSQTLINLKNTMPNKRSQTYKTACCMFLVIQAVHNGQINGDKED